jgi:hypothetical protein
MASGVADEDEDPTGGTGASGSEARLTVDGSDCMSCAGNAVDRLRKARMPAAASSGDDIRAGLDDIAPS